MSQAFGILRRPLYTRALVLGALAGIGLVLVQVFSTRGPLIFIPYAAMFAALAPLLARHRAESFVARTSAGFVAFITATLIAYAYIVFWANPGFSVSFSAFGRFVLIAAGGAVLAAAIAFIVGDPRSQRAA